MIDYHAGVRAGRRLSVAPMMGCTDRHFRFLARLYSPNARLYSEMVTTGALIFGDAASRLAFDPSETPVALQLGGADPAALARCAAMGEAFGYDEINLNVGCPSDRAGSGRFGACLMAEPGRVADGVAAMRRATALPVTVKCRIGIDDSDAYDDLRRFVEIVADAGCDTFVVHARKAVLGGLNPSQNRSVPPLRPEFVHRLKRERPDLEVVVNGGIRTVEAARAHLPHVDGVMVGRAAYDELALLAALDHALCGGAYEPPEPREALEAYVPYAEARLAEGVALPVLVRPLMGIVHGRAGARAFRRAVCEGARVNGAGPEVIARAAALLGPPAEAARAA